MASTASASLSSVGSPEVAHRKAAVASDVFITAELNRRIPKVADYLREKVALQDLARQMVDHPA